MLLDNQYSGVVSSVSGSTVSFSADLPPIVLPAYVHVVDDLSSALGSVNTVLSIDGASVVLEDSVSGLAVGERVVIRKHFTVGDVIVAGGGSIADNSTLRLFNSDGTVDTYQAIENDWYPSGSFTPQNDAIIFPGEGFVLNLQALKKLVFAGSVSVDPISVPLASGIVNVFGAINPGEGSVLENTTLGNVLASLDNNSTIRIFSSDGSLSPVQTYQLIDGDWYASGSFVPTEVKISGPASVVVSSQSDKSVNLAPAYTN
jgi:hypothetical protein